MIISALIHCTTLALPLPFSQDNFFSFAALPWRTACHLSSDSPSLVLQFYNSLPNGIHPYFLSLSNARKQNTGSSWCGMVFLTSLTCHFPQSLGLSHQLISSHLSTAIYVLQYFLKHSHSQRTPPILVTGNC